MEPILTDAEDVQKRQLGQNAGDGSLKGIVLEHELLQWCRDIVGQRPIKLIIVGEDVLHQRHVEYARRQGACMRVGAEK